VKNDPEAILVQVSKKVEEVVAPVVAPAVEGAEPEVIGRVKEEVAEEEEKKSAGK